MITFSTLDFTRRISLPSRLGRGHASLFQGACINKVSIIEQIEQAEKFAARIGMNTDLRNFFNVRLLGLLRRLSSKTLFYI
jgi:hypothetical protein